MGRENTPKFNNLLFLFLRKTKKTVKINNTVHKKAYEIIMYVFEIVLLSSFVLSRNRVLAIPNVRKT